MFISRTSKSSDFCIKLLTAGCIFPNITFNETDLDKIIILCQLGWEYHWNSAILLLIKNFVMNLCKKLGTNNWWNFEQILWRIYPFVSYSHLSSFRQAYAHYLLSGMLNPFFCLDNCDSTNIGLTDKISISGFYKERASLKNVFIAFVAEYKQIKGWGFWPAKEDKLIMADFPFLAFSCPIN